MRAGITPGPLLLQPYCNPLAEDFALPERPSVAHPAYPGVPAEPPQLPAGAIGRSVVQDQEPVEAQRKVVEDVKANDIRLVANHRYPVESHRHLSITDLPDVGRMVSDPGRFSSPGAPNARLNDSVRSRTSRNDTFGERGYENSPLRNL